jgi:hypothetical protein
MGKTVFYQEFTYIIAKRYAIIYFITLNSACQHLLWQIVYKILILI